MDDKDLCSEALAFRTAIMKAKRDGAFDYRDRMHNFPHGCCDDSCDLFAYYLLSVHGIHTKQGNGVFRDDNPYNTTNHAWLFLENGTVIDITADQFDFFLKYSRKIYVGEENIFYKCLENKKVLENYDVTQDSRLWSDYQTIMNYMEV